MLWIPPLPMRASSLRGALRSPCLLKGHSAWTPRFLSEGQNSACLLLWEQALFQDHCSQESPASDLTHSCIVAHVWWMGKHQPHHLVPAAKGPATSSVRREPAVFGEVSGIAGMVGHWSSEYLYFHSWKIVFTTFFKPNMDFWSSCKLQLLVPKHSVLALPQILCCWPGNIPLEESQCDVARTLGLLPFL